MNSRNAINYAGLYLQLHPIQDYGILIALATFDKKHRAENHW
jgi:hypothetical protein